MGEPFHLAPTGTKDAGQHRRRDLRIAIRQLDRAELYVVALTSLELDDERAENGIEDLTRRVRSLRHYLIQQKLTV